MILTERASSTTEHPLVDLFDNLLCPTVLVSFDNPGHIIQALHLSCLALKVGTNGVRVPSPLAVVDLILRLMIPMRAAGVGVPINESDPLYVIANMMIILVSAHYEVFLGLLDAEVPDRFSSLPTYVDVCEILLGLAVLALLVREARQRGTLLDVDALN